MLADGSSTEEIGSGLFLSLHTVRNHVRNILTKLHARTKLEAVVIAGTRRTGRSAPRHVRSLRGSRRGRSCCWRSSPPSSSSYRRSRATIGPRPATTAPTRHAGSPTTVARASTTHLLGDTRTLLRAIGSIPAERRSSSPSAMPRSPQSPARRRRTTTCSSSRPTGRSCAARSPVRAAVDPDTEWFADRARTGGFVGLDGRTADPGDTVLTVAIGLTTARNGPFVVCRADRVGRAWRARRDDATSTTRASVTLVDGANTILFQRPDRRQPSARRSRTTPSVRGAARVREPRCRRRRRPRRRPAHLHR